MSKSAGRPPGLIREEIEDLVSYLEGLPDALRRSGATNAYEARLRELQRELMVASAARKPASRRSDPQP